MTVFFTFELKMQFLNIIIKGRVKGAILDAEAHSVIASQQHLRLKSAQCTIAMLLMNYLQPEYAYQE